MQIKKFVIAEKLLPVEFLRLIIASRVLQIKPIYPAFITKHKIPTTILRGL